MDSRRQEMNLVERIFDAECRPDQEALAYFYGKKSIGQLRVPLNIWLKLDLSPEKARELVTGRQQHEAVWRLVKDNLAKKLMALFIMYCVICVIAMCLKVVLTRPISGSRIQYGFLVFAASNFIYIGFLMLLSFSYGLYTEFGWRIALSVASVVMILPFVYQQIIMPDPLVIVALSVAAIFVIPMVTKRARLWKRLRFSLAKERLKNTEENSNRADFRNKVEEFFRVADEKSRQRWLHRHVFKWLRRWIIKSAVDITYTILTDDNFADRKGALEEYMKRHRLKDSMGRLATVVWIGGALAYLIFPLSLWAEDASLAAVSVLPLYAAAMFVMEQIDEAQDEVFLELSQLMISKSL